MDLNHEGGTELIMQRMYDGHFCQINLTTLLCFKNFIYVIYLIDSLPWMVLLAILFTTCHALGGWLVFGQLLGGGGGAFMEWKVSIIQPNGDLGENWD